MKAQAAQILQRLGMGRERPALHQLQIENQNIQLPLGGNFRIQLPQRSGGSISGIGEKRLPQLLPLLIQLREDLFGHEYLTPDNHPLRSVRQIKRNGADGLEVFGDVLPYLPVSAGGAANEVSVQIFQRDGQPVHLRFHRIRRL